MNRRQERRRLREIERWFESDDPVLAAALAGPRVAPGGVKAGGRSARVGVAVLGVALVVVGALTHLLLVFAGILSLMTAACMHVSRPNR
ncbi:hypothetical protein SUDANB95_02805 [Actinosynnema sp. ALI-1.44]